MARVLLSPVNDVRPCPPAHLPPEPGFGSVALKRGHERIFSANVLLCVRTDTFPRDADLEFSPRFFYGPLCATTCLRCNALLEVPVRVKKWHSRPIGLGGLLSTKVEGSESRSPLESIPARKSSSSAESFLVPRSASLVFLFFSLVFSEPFGELYFFSLRADGSLTPPFHCARLAGLFCDLDRTLALSISYFSALCLFELVLFPALLSAAIAAPFNLPEWSSALSPHGLCGPFPVLTKMDPIRTECRLPRDRMIFPLFSPLLFARYASSQALLVMRPSCFSFWGAFFVPVSSTVIWFDSRPLRDRSFPLPPRTNSVLTTLGHVQPSSSATLPR